MKTSGFLILYRRYAEVDFRPALGAGKRRFESCYCHDGRDVGSSPAQSGNHDWWYNWNYSARVIGVVT